ncbi:methyl-accepting chemotaxis protein [Bosea sp. CS1GBMeth4]|uniref:methyl-accepting chemotaxis protein n=1 Tax=Bosea sp. CS1GBMeth4 TaxID=1892849 RepID=UPI00164933E8|nr:methyl-accepting chemotaxis protein [Bosea sp. CS1GBMeth4]
MRVTHFLFCTIAAGAAAILASGYIAYHQAQTLSSAREARALVVASESISRVLERAAVERGAVTQSLLASDPDGKLAAAEAQAARETDMRVGQMQEAFAGTSLAGRAELAGPVAQIGRQLTEARKLARSEAEKPLAQRDAKAAGTLNGTFSEILGRQVALQRQIGARIGDLNPEVGKAVSLGELSTGLRESAGTRSVFFTQYVGSGARLTPAAVAAVDRNTGRIEQLGVLIDQALARLVITPQLQTAIDAVKTGFRDEETRTYTAMYEAARDGKPPGMSLPDWRAWAQASLATILQLRDAAYRQATAQIDADIARAGWQLALALLAILAVTGIVAGIVMLFNRGVVRPLGKLARSVELMLSGAADAQIPPKVGMVEVDAISHALSDFDANLKRIRELEAAEHAAAEARLARARSLEAVVSDVGEVVSAAAAGDFSARLQITDADEQMQRLVAGINEINVVVDSATTEFVEVLQALAAGDLTRQVPTAYRGRFAELKDAVNETVERLASTVRTIQSTSAEVGVAAREINSGADDLSKRTEEQASSLEQTAATTEELAASVKASAQGARQAAAIAEEAMQAAQAGGAIAGEAVSAMARIEQASKKISEIVSVIDGIAFQTNLLALNAAVEAARAGDAGKGFAVVASEVRTLAQRSGEAAKDISGLISSSNVEVEAGVKLVRQAGNALETILTASQKVTGTIQEISVAADEQANGIGEMSQAVAHLDEMTQANAALAEQSAASAGALSGRIGELNALVASFRTGEGRPVAATTPPAARPAPRAPRPTALAVHPDTVQPMPATADTEPERLRQLAEAAFVQSRTAAPRRDRPAASPPARKAANGRAGDDGWEEF